MKSYLFTWEDLFTTAAVFLQLFLYQELDLTLSSESSAHLEHTCVSKISLKRYAKVAK